MLRVIPSHEPTTGNCKRRIGASSCLPAQPASPPLKLRCGVSTGERPLHAPSIGTPCAAAETKDRDSAATADSSCTAHPQSGLAHQCRMSLTTQRGGLAPQVEFTLNPSSPCSRRSPAWAVGQRRSPGPQPWPGGTDYWMAMVATCEMAPPVPPVKSKVMASTVSGGSANGPDTT